MARPARCGAFALRLTDRPTTDRGSSTEKFMATTVRVLGNGNNTPPVHASFLRVNVWRPTICWPGMLAPRAVRRKVGVDDVQHGLSLRPRRRAARRGTAYADPAIQGDKLRPLRSVAKAHAGRGDRSQNLNARMEALRHSFTGHLTRIIWQFYDGVMLCGY